MYSDGTSHSGRFTASGGTVGPQAPGIGQAPFMAGVKLAAEEPAPDRPLLLDEVGLTAVVLTMFCCLGLRLAVSLVTSSATGAKTGSDGATCGGSTGAATATGFIS